MATFGFSAFLKLLSLNLRPQRREIRQRLLPSDSAYDFHRSLRLRAYRLLVGGEDLDDLIASAATIANPAERRSVESGLHQLAAWRSENPGAIMRFLPNLFESPEGEFKVSFIPDFGVVIDGVKVAVHIWNTGSIDLVDRMTYAALAVWPTLYENHEEPPDDFAVLSLQEYRLYRLSDVPDQTALASAVMAHLDRLFEEIRGEIGGPPADAEDRPPAR
jgi:hypothetical protein